MPRVDFVADSLDALDALESSSRAYDRRMATPELRALAAMAAAAATEERTGNDEGIAAAALTSSGRTLVGVWVDAKVDSACLCAETGPICEAHRLRDPIRAIVCIRDTERDAPVVLSACGVCQERLAVFGTDVLIAVTGSPAADPEFLSLGQLRPSPWWATDGPGG